MKTSQSNKKPQNNVAMTSALKTLISVVSKVLLEICEEMDKEDSALSLFHSKKRPLINLQDYILRIGKYCNCGDVCYVMALIYIDRLQELNPDIVLNNSSVHRLFLSAIVIAIKYHEDEYYKNDFYAKVGGISLEEFNVLEVAFLIHINYKLFVDENTYSVYTTRLEMFADL